ncbi:HEAT repeat domain-containing protein [Sorangium sp. So ce1335]|uniref:HEAT repeat domain-containing protein n=1 Tax=Sorangium sp. So ce1335 TaxID=3133335 RepID=UPI003F5F4784
MNPKAAEKYVLLKPSATHEELADAARLHGWVLHRAGDREAPMRGREEVWATSDSLTAIHYVEDGLTDERYLWVRGANLDQVVTQLRRALLAYDEGELIDLADEEEEHNERVKAIIRVGLVFSRYNGEVLALYRRYLSDKDPLLRQATLFAIGCRALPEARGLVEHVADNDEDAETRAVARRMLAVYPPTSSS